MTKSISSGRRRRGQSMLEFTLVGIPLMFVLISIFEISRGMWMYHTLAFSVKDGVRFAVVHGINCVNTTGGGGSNPNNCTKTIADVARQIRDAAVILDPTQTTLTFFPGDAGATSTTCKMQGSAGTDCPQFTANAWPPAGVASLNSVGKPIRIDITAPFGSALAMFWPGPHNGPVHFGTFTLGASSTDYIQY
jgi:hypothetical protein